MLRVDPLLACDADSAGRGRERCPSLEHPHKRVRVTSKNTGCARVVLHCKPAISLSLRVSRFGPKTPRVQQLSGMGLALQSPIKSNCSLM